MVLNCLWHNLYIRAVVAFKSNWNSRWLTYGFLNNPVFMTKLIQCFIMFFVSRSNFPQLARQGSWGSKSVPMNGNSPGSLSQQKSGSGKPTEQSLSSSPASSQSLLKLKKDAMTKNSGNDMLFIHFISTLLIPISSCLAILSNLAPLCISTPFDWVIDDSLNSDLLPYLNFRSHGLQSLVWEWMCEAHWDKRYLWFHICYSCYVLTD